jgi:hypothetical protein
MADMFVPSNVSSITFAGSGVKAVASRVVTGITADEATQCTQAHRQPIVQKTSATTADILMRDGQITSITINAVAYPVTGGLISAVPADQAAIFLKSDNNWSFNLRNG